MEKLSKQCYAYPDKELYPVHTKEAALKSWQEFKRDLKNYTENELDLITGRFVKSAQARDFKYPMWDEGESTPQVQTIKDEEGNSVTFSKIASIQDVNTAVDILNASRSPATFHSSAATFLRKSPLSVPLEALRMSTAVFTS